MFNALLRGQTALLLRFQASLKQLDYGAALLLPLLRFGGLLTFAVQFLVALMQVCFGLLGAVLEFLGAGFECLDLLGELLTGAGQLRYLLLQFAQRSPVAC